MRQYVESMSVAGEIRSLRYAISNGEKYSRLLLQFQLRRSQGKSRNVRDVWSCDSFYIKHGEIDESTSFSFT